MQCPKCKDQYPNTKDQRLIALTGECVHCLYEGATTLRKRDSFIQACKLAGYKLNDPAYRYEHADEIRGQAT